jgi:hypothetical protein
VMLQPCGRSAALELGWAVGAGKHTLVLLADGQEPELMLRLADHLAASLGELLTMIAELPPAAVPDGAGQDCTTAGCMLGAAHFGDCDGFLCIGCGKRRPVSEGGADDMPEHCSECWNKVHTSAPDGAGVASVSVASGVNAPPGELREAIGHLIRMVRKEVQFDLALRMACDTVEKILGPPGPAPTQPKADPGLCGVPGCYLPGFHGHGTSTKEPPVTPTLTDLEVVALRAMICARAGWLPCPFCAKNS